MSVGSAGMTVSPRPSDAGGTSARKQNDALKDPVRPTAETVEGEYRSKLDDWKMPIVAGEIVAAGLMLPVTAKIVGSFHRAPWIILGSTAAGVASAQLTAETDSNVPSAMIAGAGLATSIIGVGVLRSAIKAEQYLPRFGARTAVMTGLGMMGAAVMGAKIGPMIGEALSERFPKELVPAESKDSSDSTESKETGDEPPRTSNTRGSGLMPMLLFPAIAIGVMYLATRRR